MEKTVTIDGRPVRFKATGGCAYRYKAQFGREMLADMADMQDLLDSAVEKQVKRKAPDGKITFEKVTTYDMTKLNLELMYNLLWVYAKTADETVPDPQTWLDSFETFPVTEIYNELQDITTSNFKVDRKNA